MSGGVPFLPESASTIAGEFNILFAGLLAITGAVLGLVFLLLFRFCAHYRRGNDAADRGHWGRKSWRWEVGWTTASFVVFLGLYAWGADLYLREHRWPSNATDIYVVGKQWMWKVEHPDGQREINALHVALNRPVRLVMTSQDVIHSFFVPAFRLKQDVVPGRYVSLWFDPTRIGDYHLYCAQFCGTDHAAMGGMVSVLSDADYQKWLAANATGGTLAAQGGVLYRKLGCAGCHETGATVHAPKLAGLYGSAVTLRNGSTALADEGFIRSAILQPAQNVPTGYAPIMPSFVGQLNEEQVMSLVAYIKSLGAKPAAGSPSR
ncbi:MAG TPA: cytochrome c oxidase subunit II [Stellaceae bacterium]|jgi:cytochrome c oxidase subunit 2|nr:cytochrome c oxidase subunit II [Stellaceae bacterium]